MVDMQKRDMTRSILFEVPLTSKSNKNKNFLAKVHCQLCFSTNQNGFSIRDMSLKSMFIKLMEFMENFKMLYLSKFPTNLKRMVKRSKC